MSAGWRHGGHFASARRRVIVADLWRLPRYRRRLPEIETNVRKHARSRSPRIQFEASISTKIGREQLKCRVRHKRWIVRVRFEQPHTPISEVLEQFPVLDSVHLPRQTTRAWSMSASL